MALSLMSLGFLGERDLGNKLAWEERLGTFTPTVVKSTWSIKANIKSISVGNTKSLSLSLSLYLSKNHAALCAVSSQTKF